MSEMDNRWKEDPIIGFENQTILLVNGKTIEIPDITPELLYEYIVLGRNVINTQLNALTGLRRDRTRPHMHRSILVGRLALVESEDRVFTTSGLIHMQEGPPSKDDFLKPYRQFWQVIENASYVPEIQRRAMLEYPDLRGTWLGLRRP